MNTTYILTRLLLLAAALPSCHASLLQEEREPQQQQVRQQQRARARYRQPSMRDAKKDLQKGYTSLYNRFQEYIDGPQRQARQLLRRDWPKIEAEVLQNIEKNNKNDDPFYKYFAKEKMQDAREKIKTLNVEDVIEKASEQNLDIEDPKFRELLVKALSDYFVQEYATAYEGWREEVRKYDIGEAHPFSKFLYGDDWETTTAFLEKRCRSSFLGYVGQHTVVLGTMICDIFLSPLRFGYKELSEDETDYSLTRLYAVGGVSFFKGVLSLLSVIGAAALIKTLASLGIPQALSSALAQSGITGLLAAGIVIMVGLGAGYGGYCLASYFGYSGTQAIAFAVVCALVAMVICERIMKYKAGEKHNKMCGSVKGLPYLCLVLVGCCGPVIAGMYAWKKTYNYGLHIVVCGGASAAAFVASSWASYRILAKPTKKIIEKVEAQEKAKTSTLKRWTSSPKASPPPPSNLKILATLLTVLGFSAIFVHVLCGEASPVAKRPTLKKKSEIDDEQLQQQYAQFKESSIDHLDRQALQDTESEISEMKNGGVYGVNSDVDVTQLPDPPKKVKKIRGKNRQRTGDYIVTTKEIWSVNPYRFLGDIEGEDPQIMDGILTTTKGIWDLKNFERKADFSSSDDEQKSKPKKPRKAWTDLQNKKLNNDSSVHVDPTESEEEEREKKHKWVDAFNANAEKYKRSRSKKPIDKIFCEYDISYLEDQGLIEEGLLKKVLWQAGVKTSFGYLQEYVFSNNKLRWKTKPNDNRKQVVEYAKIVNQAFNEFLEGIKYGYN